MRVETAPSDRIVIQAKESEYDGGDILNCRRQETGKFALLRR